ncbi:hypothetical protein PGT21_027700 [Puccinia graminis f. sp. tritici]|uniref:Uncharacterized protein n=1 Tax=Puccinia graminis f. sp. tritici TaxID=56615 RepID=A0A5B0QNY7_PUCGR|nr:hypothetical protein PGT21_027700 [Puccinia graminis f. sp. tritici]
MTSPWAQADDQEVPNLPSLKIQEAVVTRIHWPDRLSSRWLWSETSQKQSQNYTKEEEENTLILDWSLDDVMGDVTARSFLERGHRTFFFLALNLDFCKARSKFEFSTIGRERNASPSAGPDKLASLKTRML